LNNNSLISTYILEFESADVTWYPNSTEAQFNQMQSQIDIDREKYGQNPYRLDEFFDTLAQHRKELLYLLPTGWPLLFIEHHRLYKEKGNGFFMGRNRAAAREICICQI